MNEYSKLKEYLRIMGGGERISIWQGIVRGVRGNVCDVEIGSIMIPGVRLRASETEDEGELLVTPKTGSAVTVGSLSGDLRDLVVLQMDHAERVVVNGGKLGGLINIEQLTSKMNELVDAFNSHTHEVTVAHPGGTFMTAAPTGSASPFRRGDYEDELVKH